MLFAKLKNDGSIEGKLYTRSQLENILSNVSLPKTLSNDILLPLGYVGIHAPNSENLEQTNDLEYGVKVIKYVDGRFERKLILLPVSEDRKASRIKNKADRVRQKRNKLLVDTDWTQLSDTVVNKELWASYRQALRDISAQDGFPWTITWPIAPP
jgi:hypothetical protein